MPNPNAAQAYLQIDRRRYEALIERLVGEVREAHTGFLGVNVNALRSYFAVAITKGADLSGVKFDELGGMSASELARAAEALPDKLTKQSRQSFAEAAEQRPAQVRWNRLFPDGVNDIVLPLAGDAKSVDDRIAVYIEDHNAKAKAKFEEARAKDPRNAGKTIDQREIRRDPAETAKLQTVNPNKPTNPDGSKRWEPGQRLGAFLEARQEWALLDDFKLENSRKNAGAATVEERDAQARELMNRKTEIRSDELNPQSLRVVISRDPQKVGEMSSGQHWESCMSECSSEGKPGMNFHYVPKDIEAGSLVAYLVSADDPEARYPIMRQLLKPYYNQATGETVLIPAKIYGSFAGGNSRTRQALHDTLSVFVRERINDGKSGEFMMDSRLYGDGQAGIVNLQAVWDEESIKRGLIKYHDSSLQEYLTEIRSREEQVERYQTEIARQQRIIQEEDASVEAKKEAHEARKETRGGWQTELDIELEKISATAREGRVQRRLKTLQEEQASLAKVQDEIKHLHSKIKNLADPEALAKGFHRETRKTSPDSVPEPAAVLAVARQDTLVQRHKAIFEVVTNNNSKPLAGYLATEPLGDRIKLSYTIAKSIPNNAHGPNVAAEMWAGFIQELPSVDQQVAEATRAVTNYDSPDSLKKAAANVISSKFSQVSTQQQRLRSFATLVNRKQADSATIEVIAADLQNITGSRGRMDAATQALTAISELPYTPELAATKRAIFEQAYLQTDYLPNSRARFSFAAEILSFGTAPQETGITLNTEVVQHAKRLLTESFPFLGDALPKDFLPYESYFGDTKELKDLIERVKTAPAYNNDAGFQREFEQANTQREKVASLIDGVVKQTEGLESAPASQKAAERWATEVRSLGNPHAQLGALIKSEKMLEKIKDVDGKPELVKPWKQQIAILYLEVAATLPDGVIKTNCYQYAFDEMQEPIAKEQLKERLIAIASDEHNHLKPEERIGLLQKVGAVDFEAGFDLRDPAIQRIQSMSAKYLDELIIYLSPEERVMALAGNLISTPPGSEEERNLGVRFRKELEQMPIQERRAAAYQVIQQYMMFRDHPLNRTVGDFGAVAAAHAKAVLNGEVYDPDAVMVVRNSPIVADGTSQAAAPADHIDTPQIKSEKTNPALLTWQELHAALTTQRQLLLDDRRATSAQILSKPGKVDGSHQPEVDAAAFAHSASSGERVSSASKVATIDKLLKTLSRESVPNDPDYRVDMKRWHDDHGGINWELFLQNADKRGSEFVHALARETKNRAHDIQQERLPVWGKLPMPEVISLFENSEFEVVQQSATRNPSDKLPSLSLHLRPRSAPPEAGSFSAHLMFVPDENILVIERANSPTELQGKGSLKQFLDGTLALAARIGATKIELGASESAGPLAWGKAGAHMEDDTRVVLDFRTGEEVYRFLGWSDFCTHVHEAAKGLRQDPKASEEKRALLAQVEALVQEGAPKSNLQQIARLTAQIEQHPGQRLFLPDYAAYFDLTDPMQMREVHKFISAGRATQPQSQQQQQRRPMPSAEEVALQQRGLEEARRRADTAIQSARGTAGFTGGHSLVQGASNLTQAHSMAGRVTTASNVESAEFYDLGKIIDPNSPMGVAFAERMQALTERLAGDRYDLKRHQARYLLADDKTLNAYTIPSSKPPIIVIHKGLLAEIKSLDELAGVLAHEWGHILARQELGEHRVGKGEEGGADVLAVRLLAEAGMDAKALETMLLRWNEEDSYPTRLMQALTDVHPLADNRASAMEKARILLERSGFKTNHPSSPLPEEFRTYARDAHYESTTDIPARLRATGYADKPIPEQLDILVQWAQENAMRDGYGIDGHIKEHYTNQIHQAFKQISVVDAPQDVREAYHAAFSKLVHTGLWADEANIDGLYRSGLKGLGLPNKTPWEPIGDFRELRAATLEFSAAQTREVALASAGRLLMAYDVYEKNESIEGKYGGAKRRNKFLRNIALGEISYPTVEGAKEALAKGEQVYLPFAQHDQWSAAAPEESLVRVGDVLIDRPIQRAVMLLRGNGEPDGILASHGLGMFTMSQYRANFEIVGAEIKSVWPAPFELPPYEPELAAELDREHRIRNIGKRFIKGVEQPPTLKPAHVTEAEVIAHHVQWQQNLLADHAVRWDLLETNPRQFVRIYKEALTPLQTSQPCPHPFAEALIAHIQEVAASRPEAMSPEHRVLISRLLPNAEPINNLYERDKVTLGIDQNHPYVREYYALVELKADGNITFPNAARINPFGPRDAITMPFDDNVGSIDKFLTVQKVREEVSALVPKMSLGEQVTLAHQLREVPAKEYQSAKELMQASLQARIHETATFVFQQKSLADIIRTYKSNSLIEEVEGLDKRFQEHIIPAIAAIEDPAQRRGYLNDFLTTQLKVAGPKLRSTLADLVVSDILADIGKDDHTEAYRENVMRRLQSFAGNPADDRARVGGALRLAVVAKLAEHSEAQPELAAELQRYHHHAIAHGAIGSALTEGLSEGAFELIKQDPVKRAAVLNYVMGPSTDATRNALFDTLGTGCFDGLLAKGQQLQVLEKFHAEYWDMPFVARMAVTNDLIFPPGSSPKTAKHITGRMLDKLMGGDDRPIAVADLLTLDEHLKPYLEDVEKLKKTGHVSRNAAEYFDQPEGEDLKDGIRRVREAHRENEPSIVEQARNRFGIAPDRSPRATARLIVDAYLDTVAAHDPKEAQLLVSALMSAEHDRKPGEQLRLGQTLNEVLSHMGPAGAKLLQAIHSNPNTPQDIKDDLKYSKIEHDKPLRFDAIDMARNAGLLDPAKTTHVGPVVAAGSFGVTMFNTAPDGVVYADTLLRDRADAIAEREFNFMRKAAQIIAEADGRMTPALDMVRGGQYSARIETQMSLAPKQNAIAEQVMDGVQVIVRGEDGVERTTTHHVARLIEAGERYKRVEVAQGEHLLELPESTPYEGRRATILSKAAMQVVQRYAGMPMDLDRHGGNIKAYGEELGIPLPQSDGAWGIRIDLDYHDGNMTANGAALGIPSPEENPNTGIRINHFDLGMTELRLASDVQKQALGMVTAQAVKDAAGGGSFIDHLLTRISKADVAPEARSFLADFNREMLALADDFNTLAPSVPEGHPKPPMDPKLSKELAGILGQALYGEHTDPVIRAAYEEGLGPLARGKAEAAFRAAMAESSVTMSNVPSAADLQMPVLTSEERAIVENRDHGLPRRLTNPHHATRAGGAAGAAMGAAGIVGRITDTLDKAKQVGGRQLETERAALYGDSLSVVTGVSDLTPGAAQAATKAGVALRAMGRVAPIVAAGAAYLEVQAANTAQDGRRGAGAVGGFAGGMGVGMATGATAGAIFGPWGAAIGGIVGGLGAGYVGSEIGRSSQWGDQRQRDLDHKAQYALDQSVEVIAELGRKRLRGEAWTDADKAAIRTIGGLMVEHVNRMQVLEIPASDIDGRLRQQYQIQQTQHVIDYLNGKTERLPMASQQRDAHLIESIEALLPQLNDSKLGWKPWLQQGTGAVDRNDVLRTLSEYGVELHTLDKDGRKGITIDELTNVLKALKVDQRGKVTPARGAAHVERPPEINDETHANFRDGTFERAGGGQKRFESAMASWIPELEKAGFGRTIGGSDGKITPEKLGEAMKRAGLRASEVDQDGSGNITEREAINALRAQGLDRPPTTPQSEASQATNPQIRR